MTDFIITEATTVQFSTIRHASDIGGVPMPPQIAARKRRGRPERSVLHPGKAIGTAISGAFGAIDLDTSRFLDYIRNPADQT